jgi:hypothetical protein
MPFEKGHAPFPRRAVVETETLERETTQFSPPPIIVSRFLLADAMSPRGQWLVDRLVAKWPHLSPATFSGRLRAWIGSNSHYLTKTPHGVGLSRIVRTELDALPIAEEVFLFLEEPKEHKYDREGFAIYRDTGKWAKSLGASRYIIDRNSDCVSNEIARRLGAREDVEVSLIL